MSQKQQIALSASRGEQYGLGDMLRTVLRKNSWFSKLESLAKTKDIKLLVCSHNENTSGLFKNFSYLEAVKTEWKNGRAQYLEKAKELGLPLWSLDKTKNQVRSLPAHEVKIPLDEEEKRTLAEIMQHKYVILHPFAGGHARIPIKPKEYGMLCELITKQKDHHVVVLGHSYIRGNRRKKIPSKHIQETFGYRHEKVINLVNKTSVRLAVELLRESTCFFGNWSAFLCAAWEMKKPAVVFTGTTGKRVLSTGKTFSDRWHNKCLAIDTKSQSTRKSFNQAIAFYKSLRQGL